MMMKLILFIGLSWFALDSTAQAGRKYIRQGNGKYEGGKYQDAEVEYRKALEKDSNSYKADYNLGNALYKQKQYDAAAARYAELAKKDRDEKRLGDYYYNYGNTMFENKRYQESVEAYKNALRNNPSDMDAKHNLQMALRMLNEQKQKQNGNNQQQNKDSKDQKNNKNQQNKNQQNNDQQNKDQQNKNQQQNQDQQKAQSGNQQNMPKEQISKEDADRILQALENEEKDVMKRVQDRKEHAQKVPVDKNW